MSHALKNDRLIKALLCQPVDCTPVWVMRQAGRYLPEYKEVRQHAGDFLTLCKTPELACQVTLQPLARFDLDAAIIFSDILTIPDAMGLGLYFAEGEGPRFTNPIKNAQDVKKIAIPDPEAELSYVCDAIRVTRDALKGKVPLIGFSGSPWTLATYMVEGGSSKSFSKIKALMYEQPLVLHELLEKLSKSVIEYLNAQIKAGAQTVMIFDSWGGLLTPSAYEEFSLSYMQMIVDGLIKQHEGQPIPSVLFTKGGNLWLDKIMKTDCSAIGVDWTTTLDKVYRITKGEKAVQGNLDPTALYAQPEVIRQHVATILADYGKHPGHVFNLGHGILPDINPEHVKVLVDSVHELSRQYH